MSQFQNTGQARATAITVRRYIDGKESYRKEYAMDSQIVTDVPYMTDDEYDAAISLLIDQVKKSEPGIEINASDAIKTDIIACPINQ